jgi:Fe-S-cluster containining protein
MELKLLPSLPPSEACFACCGCCVFLTSDAPWIPYFRKEEINQAIIAGISQNAFPSQQGSHIIPVSHGDAFRCPALDPDTHSCTIYNVRPLDCFIYPFILMWDRAHKMIFLTLHEACPFVFTQTNPLPETLVCRGADLTLMLQTPQMIESLRAHPGMIMATQPDTILIAPLDRLTKVMTN